MAVWRTVHCRALHAISQVPDTPLKLTIRLVKPCHAFMQYIRMLTVHPASIWMDLDDSRGCTFGWR